MLIYMLIFAYIHCSRLCKTTKIFVKKKVLIQRALPVITTMALLRGNSCTWAHDIRFIIRSTSCAQVHELQQSHCGRL